MMQQPSMLTEDFPPRIPSAQQIVSRPEVHTHTRVPLNERFIAPVVPHRDLSAWILPAALGDPTSTQRRESFRSRTGTIAPAMRRDIGSLIKPRLGEFCRTLVRFRGGPEKLSALSKVLASESLTIGSLSHLRLTLKRPPDDTALPLILLARQSAQYQYSVADLAQLGTQQFLLWLAAAFEGAANDVSPRLAGSLRADAASEKLSLLSYNVCGSSWLFPSLCSTKKRMQRIADYLQGFAPGIITLQEAWSASARTIPQHLGLTSIACGDARAGLVGSSGLLTAASAAFPIVDYHRHVFKKWSGIEYCCRKGALFTEHESPTGGRRQVWNVHLASAPEGLNHACTTDRKAAAVREMQKKELWQWVGLRRRPGVPVFIIGDFNTDEDLSTLGTDLFRARHPLPASGTEPSERQLGVTFDPVRNRFARGRLASPRRLDRGVLHNWDLAQTSVKAEVVLDKGCEVNSDHFALHFEAYLHATRSHC